MRNGAKDGCHNYSCAIPVNRYVLFNDSYSISFYYVLMFSVFVLFYVCVSVTLNLTCLYCLQHYFFFEQVYN